MSVQTDASGREAEGSTRVKVSGETAERLYRRKGRRESYEDVIRRMLENTEPDTGGSR